MVVLSDTAGRLDLQLERFELIPAGDDFSLLRVDARWLLAPGLDAPLPTLVAETGERFESAGASDDWRFPGDRLWTATYAVSGELLDGPARFSLEQYGRRFALPAPAVPADEVAARPAGRPHLLVAAGIMAAAVTPLATPAAANADEQLPQTEVAAAATAEAEAVPATAEAATVQAAPADAPPLEPTPAEAAPAIAPAPEAPAAPAPAPAAAAPAAEAPATVEVEAVEPAAKAKAHRKAKAKAKHHQRQTHKRKQAHKRKHRTHVAPAKRVTTTAPAPHAAPAAPAAQTTPAVPTGLDPTPHVTDVPSPLLENFAIPPFLLPIYQAAAAEYDIPWTVLAAVNEVETNYGRNLNISSAGALGWMQFMPATWQSYGVDANLDGQRDPFNPADAIFAAARYLHAAGASDSVSRAIFAYNHADWYVQMVLAKARVIAKLPTGVVDSLTGLTQARFPVPGKKVSYTHLDAGHWRTEQGNPRRTYDAHVRAAVGHAVVAANDGKVIAMGHSRLGGWLVLEDVYGNRFTYGHLGEVARRYATPKPRVLKESDVFRELHLPRHDDRPARAATAGRPGARKVRTSVHPQAPVVRTWPKSKERLFANPSRPSAWSHGGRAQIDSAAPPSVLAAAARALGLKPSEVVMRRLRKGSRVVAGTVLGRLGGQSTVDGRAHVNFRVRPAGKGAPSIDPTPLLDGWKLLASTDVYGPAGSSTLVERRGSLGIGRLMLMNKGSLAQRVLDDRRITIYEAGRADIQAGLIDRRILATLAFLAESGLHPTVSCLRSGHSLYTSSGNVSEHVTGDAVDIAAINGVPIIGHQGEGSITETTIKRLLQLQGGMKPHQIISLMTFAGTDNTLAMADHNDHIHVGFRPDGDARGAVLGKQVAAVLKPGQWSTLMGRLAAIKNPRVPSRPSRFALKVRKEKGS